MFATFALRPTFLRFWIPKVQNFLKFLKNCGISVKNLPISGKAKQSKVEFSKSESKAKQSKVRFPKSESKAKQSKAKWYSSLVKKQSKAKQSKVKQS